MAPVHHYPHLEATAPYPDLLEFEGVTIYPATARNRPNVDWPDYYRQTAARHHWQGTPRDVPPLRDTAPAAQFDTPANYLGPFEHHFGHFAIERATRIPQALVAHPERPFLLNDGPGVHRPRLPPHVFTVCEWLGVSRDRLVVLPGKTQVARLAVAAQAEHLDSVLPPAPYLDYLDGLPARHGILPEQYPTVFVTRAKLRPAGRHAGESYLARAFARIGVHVMAPETLPFPQQMRIFAGAGRLIFTEGSAIHCRQLMGRLPQSAVILCRRNTKRVSQLGLQARMRSVSYAEVTRDLLTLDRATGESGLASGLSMLDVDALLDCADLLDLPLREVWSGPAFRAAEAQDLLGWLDISVKWRAIVSPEIVTDIVHRAGFPELEADAHRATVQALRRHAARRKGMQDRPGQWPAPRQRA